MTFPDITTELPPVWQVDGYTHHRTLGAGASGLVVLAVHDATGTPVAIKYLNPELAGDPQWRAGFRAEARLLAEVDNPHVARFYEYVEAPASAAIVMELVDGVSLRQMLRSNGPTDPQTALFVLKGSLLGLSAAHHRGVVHRDYKPENVLVQPNGESKLADFGIASHIGTQVDLSGTPGYMAPEQWHGDPPTPATDIYAATATFYECLTGRQPFHGTHDLTELQLMHEHGEIPTEDAPPAVQGLLRHGLAKLPEQRPASADEFLELLEGVAVAAYGAQWEEEGRRKIAERVALLLMLLPSALAPEVWAEATSVLNTGFRVTRRLVLASTTALVIVLAAVGFGMTGGGSSSPGAGSSNSPTPGVSATATPSGTGGGSPTASADPTATLIAPPLSPSTTSASPTLDPTTPSPSVSTSTNPPDPFLPVVLVITNPKLSWVGGFFCLQRPTYLHADDTFTARGNGDVTFHFVYTVPGTKFKVEHTQVKHIQSDGLSMRYQVTDDAATSLFGQVGPNDQILVTVSAVQGIAKPGKQSIAKKCP